jgi:hypothetical protein
MSDADPGALLCRKILEKLVHADRKALSAALHNGNPLLLRHTDDDRFEVRCGPVRVFVARAELTGRNT